GGEKARLLFALMSREAPQILLLDEPTNHLDVDSRQALIQAINEYDGAVVLVSHDPHLIELIADRLWLVAEGTVRSFDGDLQDYRKLLIEQRRAERRRQRDDTSEQPKGASKKDKRRAAAEARAAVADLRREIRRAERRVEKLDAKKSALEVRLADPEVYNGPTAALMKLQMEHGAVKQALEEAEEAWLAAQEALEEAG
ncbi:MAG: AAA family ATPase, partial [Rhodospirillales bacterium]|nr:AAA family ATPase [Rhodospirillales bacterium]